ncbi:protein trichome birefringence-like 18 [Phalaenopsis equestris]|uniref:protein trichome birefringence-like 18 n=1 Tax=Phalaenopsis equestris TaxID=78828 RepID=UPI0009E31B09|nr:protein trichome birefringence-like 18 [Phalaenopsis equestris]
MILTSKSLFPWLLIGSFIFFIFSQNSSSPPFRIKELKQRFNGGWKPGCDITNGSWVRDNGSSHGYTNQTCKTLPESKNCGKYGKKGDYERWRWQPTRCELPRFSAVEFLEISRGKRMAFVGDSVARNQADSLVCFLSEVRLIHFISNQKNKTKIISFNASIFSYMHASFYPCQCK